MIEVSDRAAMDAVAQFFRRKQSLRRAEAGPSGGDGEKAVLRAQILRDKRHAPRCCRHGS